MPEMTEQTADDAEVQHLVVTGPLRERLYRRFVALFAGRTDVVVLKDRRLGERRRGPAPPGVERRQSDRRQRPPDWVFPPE